MYPYKTGSMWINPKKLKNDNFNREVGKDEVIKQFSINLTESVVTPTNITENN